MKSQISGIIDSAITFLLLLVAGVTPILFLNQTTEFYEMPKLVFLVVSTLILLGLWMFSWIIKGKIVITKTPLDIPLLFLLAVIVISTFFSSSRYSSIYGNFPTVHGSAVAWATYILLYFVTASHLKNVAQIKTFLYVLYASATAVALVSLLSFFGIFLPFPFASAVNFTPAGSTFSAIAFLMLLLPLPLLSIINANKYLPVPFALALALLFGVTIALIGSLPAHFALLIALAACFLISKPQEVRKSLALFLVPVVVIGLTLTFVYLPFPGNKIHELSNNFPREIQLPFAASWKISASAFRDAPFVGTGPSTYLFNFTSYKPAEFNLLSFWNISFGTAYNEFLQVLGTLGLFGFVSLIVVCLIVLKNSWKNLSAHNQEASHDGSNVILPALAISSILSIVLLFIHTTTLVSLVVTLFIFAALMMSQKSIREKVMELSIGIKASTNSNQLDLFPILLFAIFLIAAVPALIRTFTVVTADYYHRLALSQASKSGSLTYQNLQKAESLNPFIDLYRVDMAQTNFALANAIAAKTLPSQDGKTKGVALTDEEKKTMTTLLSQSVNEGRAAIALSPRSARNWEVLASIYRNITGVAQNALAFSLEAYGRAIQLDPLNPALRISVGGIYYSAKNYDLAIRFFSDAANLKPDYANAYFNLAIALRDKGDLANAKVVAERTVTLSQKFPNSPDLKIANLLLDDINKRIAKGVAEENAQKAPAGETNSALSKETVPGVNVKDLDNAPSVTPPPAVKRNPNANLPQVSPTVKPSVTP